MSQSKLLTIDDLTQFKELLNRKYHAKEPKAEDSDKKFISSLRESGNSNIRVYGYFNDEGELLSASCQHLWRKMPYYTMTWGLIHPKFSNTPFNKSVEESGARHSFDIAVHHGESINRYTFFYGMTLRNLKTRRDLWLKEKTYLTENYERNIETIIKAGKNTEYEPWQQIIGFQPRQQDIVIKVCRLKPKILYNKLYDEGLIDITYDHLYG